MENKLEKNYLEALKKIKAKKRVPLLKVIRLKCADCVCWQEQEIRLCPSEGCILWEFRMGKNPIKKIISPEQRKQMSDNAKKNFKRQ